MKKTIINFDHTSEWEAKSLTQKREFTLMTRHPVKSYDVVSDIDGKGWYVGEYSISPMLSINGTPFLKSECISSCTFKNGKFWGNMNFRNMLIKLAMYAPKFEFVPMTETLSGRVRCSAVSHISKSVATDILTGKITSQEGIYKAIAHTSYKDAHWKLVRTCIYAGIPFFKLKIACRDLEALNINNEIFSENNMYTFSRLVDYAIIHDRKISCRWSIKRVSEELLALERTHNHEKLLAMPVVHVWSETPFKFGDFKLIDTERDAFETGMIFDNCVHRCYWNQIARHKYIVFASNNVCIGYRVMEDGDVWYDQCHGPRNCDVPNAQEIDAMLRPIAQEVVNNCKIATLIEDELPY